MSNIDKVNTAHCSHCEKFTPIELRPMSTLYVCDETKKEYAQNDIVCLVCYTALLSMRTELVGTEMVGGGYRHD